MATVDAWLAARVEELRTDRVHGAGFLARRAVGSLVEAAERGLDPVEAARALAEARPAMGAIAGAVGRVAAAGQVTESGPSLLARYERAPRSIAVLFAGRANRPFTHSTSATVREAFGHAGVSPEASPATADAVVVGADAVFEDGSVVNAAGTRELAARGLPLLVLAETLKLVPTPPRVPEDAAFDLTPAELVRAILTEEGAFAPSEIASLCDRTPFLREGFELLGLS